MAAYGIKIGSIINLVKNLNWNFKIFLKDFTGKTITLGVVWSDDVLEIFWQLMKNGKIPD